MPDPGLKLVHAVAFQTHVCRAALRNFLLQQQHVWCIAWYVRPRTSQSLYADLRRCCRVSCRGGWLSGWMPAGWLAF